MRQKEIYLIDFNNVITSVVFDQCEIKQIIIKAVNYPEQWGYFVSRHQLGRRTKDQSWLNYKDTLSNLSKRIAPKIFVEYTTFPYNLKYNWEKIYSDHHIGDVIRKIDFVYKQQD